MKVAMMLIMVALAAISNEANAKGKSKSSNGLSSILGSLGNQGKAKGSMPDLSKASDALKKLGK